MSEKPKLTPVVKRLVALRTRRRQTQEAFAKSLRISVFTLRNWERGRTVPDTVTRRFIEFWLNNQTD